MAFLLDPYPLLALINLNNHWREIQNSNFGTCLKWMSFTFLKSGMFKFTRKVMETNNINLLLIVRMSVFQTTLIIVFSPCFLLGPKFFSYFLLSINNVESDYEEKNQLQRPFFLKVVCFVAFWSS